VFPARSIPTITLQEIDEYLDPVGDLLVASLNDVRFDMDSTEPKVNVRTDAGIHELPLTGALPAFSHYLKWPEAFLKKIPGALLTTLVNGLLSTGPATPIGIRYGDMSVFDVFDPTADRIDPHDVIECLDRIIPDAQVIDWQKSSDLLHLDIVTPNTDLRQVIKDPRVDDYTYGGLRVDHHLDKSLIEVEEYWMRLACTNGMCYSDGGPRIGTRKGQTTEEYLAEFEYIANLKFSTVESRIREFYELRNHPVEDFTATLLRRVQEASLPDRMTVEMLNLAPLYVDPANESNEDRTMFDLVSYVSNFGLSPWVGGERRRLEGVAGGISGDHAVRCSTCEHIIAEP